MAAVLARTEFEVVRVPGFRRAIELLQSQRFDVVLAGYSAPGNLREELFATIRAPGAPNLTAGVVLFASPHELVEARIWLSLGANQVVVTSMAAPALQETVLSLLRAKVRLGVRVMARLSVQLGAAPAQLLCQTRDLSRTGMFAVTDSPYPPGTPVQFRLDLPGTGGTVGGEAIVARRGLLWRDRDDGLGIRFIRFSADGERRLAAFLDQRRA